ncbi:HAMP domain-containing histidine kinase [Clostridium sp. CS001]|uniref:HAMP domain-containing sensor histidine kinase n=1 Tax=Clostridium sp. CS001 TaxID=2880648 RepID=UPI001CF272E6|nr:HAMP domain-containing sensor histidine kinase [Clostridium sp. CS001]MCB2291418.1 HAMP domain-containing histidine kinase [Clostridium sp. CS001]
MNIKRITILIIITLAVFIGGLYYILLDRNEAKIDVVAVNDISQALAKHWGQLQKDELPGLQYGLDYVVIDSHNNFIIATRNSLNNSLNTAISNQDTIVDIKLDNTVLGKLIIYNNTTNIWKQHRKYLFKFSVFLMVLIAIICLAYAVYIDKSIFRPFRKLQSFARNVAEGKLDAVLEMDKGNKFGAFTESFDLMREELNIARENERMANQSKKELVASLSHDIKTPVASIKAVCDLMHVKSSDEIQKSQLEVINSKADQINTLITNLFDATLEELQELKVTTTEQSSKLLYNLIKNADYNNQVSIERIPECIVVVDELRLAQVIDNLISNSYKYAGTSIEASSNIKGKYLEIAFKDYGVGVDIKETPLLFNKFYRAKNSVGKSGAGLGLYISKFLMNKMSGSIQCKNQKDGFVIILNLLIA